MGLLSFLTAACGAAGGRPAGYSDDDVQNAALKIVYPLPSCRESWLGGTAEQCEWAQEELNRRRKEYETFEPAWMRKAIMAWFDFAQREINEARDDVRTQKSRREQDEYRKRTADERQRASDLLKSIGR